MKVLLTEYDTMNQRVAKLTEERGHKIIGTIEPEEHQHSPYKTYHHIAEAQNEADVAIDSSNPNLLLPLLDEDFELPLVVAITGEKEKLIQRLEQLSERMPVFFSVSMSYGVYALTRILEVTIPFLHDYDIELTETHHNKKADAPSGTLVKLCDVTKGSRENVTPIYNRHERAEKRGKDEVGIHSVRGGTIVDERDVLFVDTDGTITISHKARSKDVFVNGAITAAKKLNTKSDGLYMFDNLQNNLRRF